MKTYEQLESTNEQLLKLQISQTGKIPPSTQMQTIKAKFNIDDVEFIKTINMIDHWLKIPSPQKSLQNNIISNMLEKPSKTEQFKFDIDE